MGTDAPLITDAANRLEAEQRLYFSYANHTLSQGINTMNDREPTPFEVAECRARFIALCNSHSYAHALNIVGTEYKSGHALTIWQRVQTESQGRQLAASEGTHKPDEGAVKAAGRYRHLHVSTTER